MPGPVQRNWGRKWPEDVDASAVQIAIVDYVNAYPEFVKRGLQVVQAVRLRDEARGSSAAPPEEALLRPAVFDLRQASRASARSGRPRSGSGSSAPLLDVVAQVNKDAKDWDSAIIKQINALEVGNPSPRTRGRIAKGESLEEAPRSKPPEKKPAEAEAAEPRGADMSGGMTAMMMGMGSADDGRHGRRPRGKRVFFIEAGERERQYKILPVLMTVLIDQDHIQDLLVALKTRRWPSRSWTSRCHARRSRVTKPEKGRAVAGVWAWDDGGDGRHGWVADGMMGRPMGLRRRWTAWMAGMQE